MPITDNFASFDTGLTGPICGGFDITPEDANDLATIPRAIMVAGAGDLNVVLKTGDTLTLPGLTPGVIYPFRVVRVLSTGTTATGLKGLV
ncbi:spike base protein, RCAP_Rcc01079 family [Roseovarius phycicola]|uniref:Hedgehog/Intein (Hint) domain-containing protein n=1 Tax=Roseovarius phycicola TaxID=3080976 RepID=A0ABZ2HF65_9RHOB